MFIPKFGPGSCMYFRNSLAPDMLMCSVVCVVSEMKKLVCKQDIHKRNFLFALIGQKVPFSFEVHLNALLLNKNLCSST